MKSFPYTSSQQPLLRSTNAPITAPVLAPIRSRPRRPILSALKAMLQGTSESQMGLASRNLLTQSQQQTMKDRAIRFTQDLASYPEYSAHMTVPFALPGGYGHGPDEDMRIVVGRLVATAMFQDDSGPNSNVDRYAYVATTVRDHLGAWYASTVQAWNQGQCWQDICPDVS